MRIGQRIRQRRERLGVERASLGDLLGVTEETIRQWESGKTSPLRRRMDELARALNCSRSWLETGEEGLGETRAQYTRENGGEFIIIPKYDATGARRRGVGGEIEGLDNAIAFRTDWLLRRGYNTEGLRVSYAQGDSMAPRIQEGDLVLVDCYDRSIRDGKLYMIRLGGTIKAKRLYWSYDRGLIVHSDNPSPEHTDEKIPPDRINELDLVGRIVWHGGED